MKKIFCAVALFSCTILNDGGYAADCALVSIFNDGVLWDPYVTRTPCGKSEEITEDIMVGVQVTDAEPGTHIKAGPKWTNTVYLDTVLPKGDSKLRIVCDGALGTTAECVRVDEATFQKRLKQPRKTQKK